VLPSDGGGHREASRLLRRTVRAEKNLSIIGASAVEREAKTYNSYIGPGNSSPSMSMIENNSQLLRYHVLFFTPSAARKGSQNPVSATHAATPARSFAP
ncbi:MAG: hypothetical protein Q4B46_11180, partial [Comamonadaceae bacterium]|nr:hypothetical protein [Comamonadaceae bacterium]